MKNIFIVPNLNKDLGHKVTSALTDRLLELGATVYISEEYSNCGIKNCIFTDSFPDSTDLIIVIGGDGSFIDASSYAIRYDKPILGVNLGKVGYLSELEPDEVDILSKIFKNEYSISEKMLLEAHIISDDSDEYSERLAVNDIVISHSSYLGVSDFILYSSEGGIRYRADGIVIATPAGSTAYSLSAGGPVVSHNTDAVIATPIAPHSLFNRSIVFASDEDIKIKNCSEEALKISIDGRFFVELAPKERCGIKVSEKKLKVLTFKENNMFSNLFKKMRFVEDVI